MVSFLKLTIACCLFDGKDLVIRGRFAFADTLDGGLLLGCEFTVLSTVGVLSEFRG